MARLSLLLFDHFQAALDGEPVTRFESNKVRALLAYLALESERPHSRDELAGLFWPDQSNLQARNNLRQALANLRQVIADQASDPSFLLISRSDIQFNASSQHWIDVLQFLSLLRIYDEHNHRHPYHCHSCAKRLQLAADLYTGDFLKDLSLRDSFLFEEWALLQRERLRPKALAALDGLIRHHQGHRNWEQVTYYARRALELDPWREEAHQQMMVALAASGQRSTALAQYHTCCKILEEELGIEPSETTTTLYNRLLTADPSESASQGGPDVHLPQPTSPLIGRGHELNKIIDLLDRIDCRLVTLTGPGGVGKTRLALQSAHEQASGFSDGVYFIPLAGVVSSEFLVSTIAEALSISFSPQPEPKQQLQNYLRGKEILLVLDNFEHIMPGASLLAELLASAPNLSLLVTSRERLKLNGEWVVELVGLSAGDEQMSDALILFQQQARRIRTGWEMKPVEKEDILQICRLIEGFPLAIELIVPWMRLLSTKEILEELQEDFGLMSAHHKTTEGRYLNLQTVYDRSWQLLNNDEQRVLTWLSIFRGGFDRKAAAEVAGASLTVLANYVDKSLVRRENDDRYHLHELLRHYALGKLVDRGETISSRQTQLAYYLEMVEEAGTQMGGTHQRQSLNALENDRHNIYDVLQWAFDSKYYTSAARLAGALSGFWLTRAYFDEGIYWLEKILSLPFDIDQTTTGCQCSLGMLYRSRGDYATALKWLEAAQIGFTTLKDQFNLGRTLIEIGHVYLSKAEVVPAHDNLKKGLEYVVTAGDRQSEALALFYLGNAAILQSDYTLAQKRHEESLVLRREIDDMPGMASSFNSLGVVAAYQGDYITGKAFFEESLALQRELGNKSNIALLLNNIGDMDRFIGDYTTVRQHYEEALVFNREIGGRPGIVWTLGNLGVVCREQGDFLAARDFFEAGLNLSYEIENKSDQVMLLDELGFVALCLGEYKQAEATFDEASAIHQKVGDRWLQGLAWSFQGILQYILEDFVAGQASSQKAVALAREVNAHFVLGHALTHLGHNLLAQGKNDQAQAAFQEAYDLRNTAGQKNLELEPLAGLARVALAQSEDKIALSLVNKILGYLDNNPLYGALYPFLVHLSCIQVLQATDDPRTVEILTTFYSLLSSQAERLPTEKMQKTYLAIPAHQEILRLYKTFQDGKGKSPDIQ